MNTLKRYSVLVVAQPAIPIALQGPPSPPYKFLIKGSTHPLEITMVNVESNDFYFIVDISHDYIGNAINLAVDQVRGIVSNFVYLTSSRIMAIFPWVAWESTFEERGEFVQFVNGIPVNNCTKHPLDVSKIRGLLNALVEREDEFTYRYTRAVRWYRNSLLSESPIEQLIFLWIGFEAIDPLLCNMLQIEPEPLLCGKCGNQYSTKSNLGVRRWIETLQEHDVIPPTSSFGKIRNLRGRLVHAGSKLVKLIPDCSLAVQSLEKALELALDEIIKPAVIPARTDSLSIERIVRLRLDGYISVETQDPAMTSPPLFNFRRGVGSITLNIEPPHFWNTDSLLIQLPKSRYKIKVESISMTQSRTIKSHAAVEINTK